LVFKGIFIFQIFLLLFTEISDWIIALYSEPIENCELDYLERAQCESFQQQGRSANGASRYHQE
jgi:hypothetical protein